jgi:aquaporin Z
MDRSAWLRYAAELIGTFVLVFGGVGSAVIAGDRIGFAGISLAFGLALLAMVYAIGPVSGCHVNPAVTLGALICRRIAARDVPGYVIAQIIGAIVAAGVLLIIANGVPGGYDLAERRLGANGYGAYSPDGYALGAALLAEVVLTAFLVFTVLGATDAAAPVGFAGLAIGLVLALVHLVGIPITGTSVNPARSIGPAVFVGGWAIEQLWLFIVAPLLGGGLAGALYLLLYPQAAPISIHEAEQALESEQVERLD